MMQLHYHINVAMDYSQCHYQSFNSGGLLRVNDDPYTTPELSTDYSKFDFASDTTLYNMSTLKRKMILSLLLLSYIFSSLAFVMSIMEEVASLKPD